MHHSISTGYYHLSDIAKHRTKQPVTKVPERRKLFEISQWRSPVSVIHRNHYKTTLQREERVKGNYEEALRCDNAVSGEASRHQSFRRSPGGSLRTGRACSMATERKGEAEDRFIWPWRSDFLRLVNGMNERGTRWLVQFYARLQARSHFANFIENAIDVDSFRDRSVQEVSKIQEWKLSVSSPSNKTFKYFEETAESYSNVVFCDCREKEREKLTSINFFFYATGVITLFTVKNVKIIADICSIKFRELQNWVKLQHKFSVIFYTSIVIYTSSFSSFSVILPFSVSLLFSHFLLEEIFSPLYRDLVGPSFVVSPTSLWPVKVEEVLSVSLVLTRHVFLAPR